MAVRQENLDAPWRSWRADERWQIMADYQRGKSISELASKYGHPSRNIEAFLRSKQRMLRPVVHPPHPEPTAMLRVDIATGRILEDRRKEVIGYGS